MNPSRDGKRKGCFTRWVSCRYTMAEPTALNLLLRLSHLFPLLKQPQRKGVAGVEQFLLDAGNGAGWREAQYSGYETVVIELVPNATEEFLLKAFYGSAFLAIPMLPATVVALRWMRKRSDT